MGISLAVSSSEIDSSDNWSAAVSTTSAESEESEQKYLITVN